MITDSFYLFCLRCLCRCCLAQFPGSEHVYLVGSESGSVYQCSKAYGSDYLASFSDHCMPVYAVKWNGMHPGIFLSCSADWSIKVRHKGIVCARDCCDARPPSDQQHHANLAGTSC